MPIWSVPARVALLDGPQPAYPAAEVDAWAGAVTARGTFQRQLVAQARIRAARAEAQIRRVEATRDAIEKAAARAEVRLGSAGGPDGEVLLALLAEARGGALGILASACRRVAELCSTLDSSPEAPATVASSPHVPELVTHQPGLDLQRVYLAGDAERYMDAVGALVGGLSTELAGTTARAAEAEDRLFELGEIISIPAPIPEPPEQAAPDIDLTAPCPVSGDDEDHIGEWLAAARSECLEILAVARKAIADMYRQADKDLFGPAGSWSEEQRPA